MPRSMPRRMAHLALLLSLIIASGCEERVKSTPVAPRAADLAAVLEAKPLPTSAILDSAQASEDYNAEVEAWGDRLHAAGARICRFYADLGAKLTVKCPAAEK